MKVTLDYCVEKLPDNIMYYGYPYPYFITVFPNSSAQLFSESSHWYTKLINGKWTFKAKIGYLNHRSDFFGIIDHELRDRIVLKQVIVESNEAEINII